MLYPLPVRLRAACIEAAPSHNRLNGDRERQPGSDRIFYLGDANYNVTAVAQYNAGSGTWQVAERYSYDPYGKVTVYEHELEPDRRQPISRRASTTRSSTPAKRSIVHTGLYYDRAPLLQPAIGPVH